MATITGQPPNETAAEFAAAFFKRHPSLHKFAPSKVIDGQGSGGHHPEAFQKGNDIHLLPKFWLLDATARDWAFTHELGHYVLSKHGLAQLIKHLNELKVDPWDTSSLPYGQGNMDEAFADSFADYFLNRSELKRRYPEWDTAVHAIVG